MGLTQMNDKMGMGRGMSENDPHPSDQIDASKLVANTKTWIHHVTNPLFCKSVNEQCSGDDEESVARRKSYIKQLKESIRLVNRVRPTVVVACGHFDDSCRKILSKVNESVPVILHDGTSYFNFWVYGAHCVAMPLRYFEEGGSSVDDSSRTEALAWFRMELEQIKTARSSGYVFVDGDARGIPSSWTAKIGKSHVLGVLGLCDEEVGSEDEGNQFETQFVVAEMEKKDCVNDDISVSSSDSDDDDDAPVDEHVMRIVGRAGNGVRCITVPDEEPDWDSELLL